MDDNRGNVLGRDGNSEITGPEWMKGIKENIEADLVSKSVRKQDEGGGGVGGGSHGVMVHSGKNDFPFRTNAPRGACTQLHGVGQRIKHF